MIALALASASACTQASTQCDCADSSLTVNVPVDRAAAVDEVRLSGTACDGVKPTCVNQTGGCSQYRFEAAAAGTCHVDVFFSSGQTFSADVTVARSTGCCAGFYASPPEAAVVNVEAPSGSADAGGE